MKPAIAGPEGAPGGRLAPRSTAGARRRHGRLRRRERLAFFDPCFPITFFLRNVLMLEAEAKPGAFSRPLKPVHLLRMVRDRCRIFLEVKTWTKRREDPAHQARRRMLNRFLGNRSLPDASYCTHCGGCCELRSGLPDFPPDAPIPSGWRELFGNNLGRRHRFCPFLWEVEGTGQSFCAIHHYRPNPCRAFEEEECEYLRRDSDFLGFSPGAARLRAACRRLLRLL